jgi:hypothetical protein
MFREDSNSIGLNDGYPLLTRLVHFAWARADAKGHAVFQPAELCGLLKRPRQAIDKLIKSGIRDGWLLPGSGSRCIIVQRHITDLKNAAGPCPIHDR